MKEKTFMKTNNKAFTLVELLVVILIIGILAAIAVPQYQKAVMKANLHKGIPLVESLYQAQQAYALTHGDFATDIDALDITIPKDSSCEKKHNENTSQYNCPFGTFGLNSGKYAILYLDPNGNYVYIHYLRDYTSYYNITLEKGKRYCWAKPANKIANEVCQSMGGTYVGSYASNWNYYELN